MTEKLKNAKHQKDIVSHLFLKDTNDYSIIHT